MNKYNSDRMGFEVSRGGYRRTLRGTNGSCGCQMGDTRHTHSDDEPKGTYGETLNRRGGGVTFSGTSGGGCGTQLTGSYGLTDRPVGSVYAPLHDFDGLYDPERALMRGTLFSSLDLPLEVSSRGGRCRG